MGRDRILTELRRLTAIEGVLVENAPTVERAIRRFADAGPGFADCLVLEAARSAQALPVLTFDQRFARQPEVVPVAAETVP